MHLRLASRFGKSHYAWSAPHPPSVARLAVTVVVGLTAPMKLNKRHGIGLIARSCASLLSVRSWRSLLRRSFRFSGRPSRSLDG